MHEHSHAGDASGDPRDLTGPFRHAVEVQVRFADTDAMRHVNNAKYLTYCEIARIRYWTDVTGESFALGDEGAESLILAEARITYRAQAFYGEVVTVETRATRIGRSSFTLEHRLVAADPRRRDPSGRGQRVGPGPLRLGSSAPTPLSADHVAAIEAFEGRAAQADGAEDRDRVLSTEPEAIDRDRLDLCLARRRAGRNRGRIRGRGRAGSRSAG